MKVFIFHGAYGRPEENWFPWLKKELEKLGAEVIVPKFPTPENQSLGSWMNVIGLHQVDPDDILIGHSIGAALVLRILEEHRAKAAFLVAGFVGALGNPQVDGINASFFEKQILWGTVRKNCKNIFAIGSDNDPYVKMEKTNDLAKKLIVEPIFVKGAGHFNAAAGYTRFPFIIRMIKELIE
jgi:predicted alpha/beta hydrolase family esterase